MAEGCHGNRLKTGSACVKIGGKPHRRNSNYRCAAPAASGFEDRAERRSTSSRTRSQQVY